MAIKNKDGTVFKIFGPNPLMDEQNLWKGFIKHNFEWTEEIDKENKFKPGLEIKQNKEDVIFEEFKDKEIIEEIKKTIVEEHPKKEIKNKTIENHKTTQCFCLPIRIVEKKDDLYEETYRKTEYLDKFIFEAVVIEKEDIYIKFWTMEKITKNSIVYPKNKDKRWWKVSEEAEAPIGIIYTAFASDYTPSFE